MFGTYIRAAMCKTIALLLASQALANGQTVQTSPERRQAILDCQLTLTRHLPPSLEEIQALNVAESGVRALRIDGSGRGAALGISKIAGQHQSRIDSVFEACVVEVR